MDSSAPSQAEKLKQAALDCDESEGRDERLRKVAGQKPAPEKKG
jgi:hypothetical protein